MAREERIVKTFKKFYRGHSLAQLSSLTKIQKTRMFRIMNGAELKWKEAEVLNLLISKKTGGDFSNFFYDFILNKKGAELETSRAGSFCETRIIEKRNMSYLYFLSKGDRNE